MPIDRNKSFSDRQSEAARAKKVQPKVPVIQAPKPAPETKPTTKPAKTKKTKK